MDLIDELQDLVEESIESGDTTKLKAKVNALPETTDPNTAAKIRKLKRQFMDRVESLATNEWLTPTLRNDLVTDFRANRFTATVEQSDRLFRNFSNDLDKVLQRVHHIADPR